MKKKLFSILILTVFTLSACSNKPSEQEDNPEGFVIGTYEELKTIETKGATLTIKHVEGTEMEFEIYGYYAKSLEDIDNGLVNTGEALGIAHIENNSAVYTDEIGKLEFKLLENGNISIKEEGNFGGQNVSLSGEYKNIKE